MDKSLRIMALDDHQLFLKGLADCLQQLPYVSKVDAFTNETEFIRKLKAETPDVIFLDLNIPGTDGFLICREVRLQFPNMFIAILTQYENHIFLEKARRYGANAYFLKNTEPEVFAKFLREIAAGKLPGFYFPTPIPDASWPTQFNKEDFVLIQTLTEREMEVLKLIAAGYHHREIEDALGIGYETFKSHRNKILDKLELGNIVELTRFALRNNIGIEVSTPRAVH